jgi:mono/diheme cytochrome c family protein
MVEFHWSWLAGALLLTPAASAHAARSLHANEQASTAHSASSSAVTPQSAPSTDAARALFLANCATCHGESGDGKGTTKLEKPARSFKDGGFSYGNTPEALLRTITNGIPGTPMPSFASALKESERKDLARYVVSLGPPETKVTEAETVLVVRDRPLFLRGKLPSIAEGAPERPRALLVGTTDGFTFEYRVDDVRLLGVRQGGFAERTDWSGRGGEAQKPLGKLIYLVGDGNPGPTFSVREGDNPARTELSARFSATCARDHRAWIASVLYADTQPLRTRRAWVEESPRAHASAVGAGFARTISIEDLGTGGRYAVCASRTKGTKLVASASESSTTANAPAHAPTSDAHADTHGTSTSTAAHANHAAPDDAEKRAAAKPAPAAPPSRADWIVRSRPDGAFEIQLAQGLLPNESFASEGDDLELEFRIEPGSARVIEIVTLLAPSWDASALAKWKKEIEP